MRTRLLDGSPQAVFDNFRTSSGLTGGSQFKIAHWTRCAHTQCWQFRIHTLPFANAQVRSSETLIPDVYLSTSSRIEGSAVVEPPLVLVEQRHIRYLKYAVSPQMRLSQGSNVLRAVDRRNLRRDGGCMGDGHASAFWAADDVDFGIELMGKRLDET